MSCAIIFLLLLAVGALWSCVGQHRFGSSGQMAVREVVCCLRQMFNRIVLFFLGETEVSLAIARDAGEMVFFTPS